MGNFDLESGKRFLQEGELVEAIRCLLASIELDPADPEAYVELFKAYEEAWRESGDPLVLDQMRKVALAGLKRHPDPARRGFLEDGLDRTEGEIVAVQKEEEEAARLEARPLRVLPMFRGGDPEGGTGAGP